MFGYKYKVRVTFYYEGRGKKTEKRFLNLDNAQQNFEEAVSVYKQNDYKISLYKSHPSLPYNDSAECISYATIMETGEKREHCRVFIELIGPLVFR